MQKKAFLALLQCGLWNTEVRLSPDYNLDFIEIFRSAEEQSVIGLVAAGVVSHTDYNLPLTEKLTLLGKCQLIEQRNEAMNVFIAGLVAKMQEAGIKLVLVKGQGVAQCYEKPQWRTAGDIDLLLDEENYQKAKKILKLIAEHISTEIENNRHQALMIDGFDVELHGKMPIELSSRADKVIEEVVAGSCNGGICFWNNDAVEVPIPNPDNHVFLIFTHFLNHFFIEGVGLKQICDWCRLLWLHKDGLDKTLLGTRLRTAGLMTEWKVFASLAVNTLGMPSEAMPFYESSSSYKRRAKRALTHILKSGNLGHNNDVSYRTKHSAISVNIITFFRRLRDFAKFSMIFPLDSPYFFVSYLVNRIR